MDRERMQNFALSVGILMGSIKAPDILAYLQAREVTEEDAEKAYQALIGIAKAFYRDPK